MTDLSVDTPMMPGKHGGQLRRGGGRPPISKNQAEALAFLRSHAVEAARALFAKALKGDVRAAELVLAYGIGKPVDKLELTGAEGGPVRFADGLDDHEKAALKAAIDAEIAARNETDDRARTDQAVAAVGNAQTPEPGTA